MEVALFRVSAIVLAAVLSLAAGTVPVGASEEIGQVSRVQNESYALTDDGERRLATGDPVHLGERVITGPDARIEIVFLDDTSLTLGANAVMQMDTLVFDGTGGTMELDMLSGAFAFTTGLIGQNDHEDVVVTTPVSTIGIRGTTFWGGPIDDAYGVLILDGAIVVTTRGGAVVLDEVGEGTAIVSPDDAPGEVKMWPEEKTARAFATIAFDE